MTTWVSKLETNVVVYVFADEIARRNQVAPLQYFQFQLDYNLTEWKNIFEQSYEYLKKKFPQGESV